MTDAPDFSWLRIFLAFGTVLALMGGLVLGLRILAKRGVRLGTSGLGFSNSRRLKLVETLPLDMRRRLVLVACDGKEYLLLFNGERDTVVATIQGDPQPPPSAP